MPAASALGRASGFIPLGAAVLVFSLGLYLTAQAVGGTQVAPDGALVWNPPEHGFLLMLR